MTFDDRDALRAVRPVVVQEFLRSRGWRMAEDRSDRGYVVYERDAIAVDVPLHPEYPDYLRRVDELTAALRRTEQLPFAALLDALTEPVGDALALRVDTDAASRGTLSFEEALKVRQGARTLLLAAAHSVIAPQPWFPRLSRAEAVGLLGQVQEARTHRGSFVMRWLVPVDPVVGQLLEIDEPFGRRVVRLLLAALEEVRRVRSLGSYDELLQLEGKGVSGNLLAALAGMRPAAEGALEFSVSWARNRPAPRAPSPAVRLPSEALAGLDAAAAAMKERVEEPGFELVGYVTQLSRESADASRPGEVTVVPATAEGPQLPRVSIELPAQLYEVAIAAHRSGDLVRAVGTLRKVGRRWTLSDARVVRDEGESDGG